MKENIILLTEFVNCWMCTVVQLLGFILLKLSQELWCNMLLINHLGLHALNRVKDSFMFVGVKC